MNNDYKEKLAELLNIENEKICESEENEKLKKIISEGGTIPEGYRQSNNTFGVYLKKMPIEETIEELEKMVMLKKAKDIHTIKNCAIFFTILTITSLILTVIVSMSLLGTYL